MGLRSKCCDAMLSINSLRNTLWTVESYRYQLQDDTMADIYRNLCFLESREVMYPFAVYESALIFLITLSSEKHRLDYEILVFYSTHKFFYMHSKYCWPVFPIISQVSSLCSERAYSSRFQNMHYKVYRWKYTHVRDAKIPCGWKMSRQAFN